MGVVIVIIESYCVVIVLQSGMKCWQLPPSYKTSVVECDVILFSIMSQGVTLWVWLLLL